MGDFSIQPFKVLLLLYYVHLVFMTSVIICLYTLCKITFSTKGVHCGLDKVDNSMGSIIKYLCRWQKFHNISLCESAIDIYWFRNLWGTKAGLLLSRTVVGWDTGQIAWHRNIPDEIGTVGQSECFSKYMCNTDKSNLLQYLKLAISLNFLDIIIIIIIIITTRTPPN